MQNEGQKTQKHRQMHYSLNNRWGVTTVGILWVCAVGVRGCVVGVYEVCTV